MACKLLKWSSTTFLPCSCNRNSEIVLCVSPDLVLPPLCPEQETRQPYEYSFIEARLAFYCETVKNVNGTPVVIHHYTFAYDTDDLQPEVEALTVEDIQGAFCKDCLAEYAEQLAGQEVHIAADSDESALVNQHGCTYPLDLGPFGLFLPDFMFGDGSDGDLLVTTGNEEILPEARTFFFNNITIEDGAALIPIGQFSLGLASGTVGTETYFEGTQGVVVFVKDTLTIDGAFHWDGEAGETGGILTAICGNGGIGARGGNPGLNRASNPGIGGFDCPGGCSWIGAVPPTTYTNSFVNVSRFAGGRGGYGVTGGHNPTEQWAPPAIIPMRIRRFIWDAIFARDVRDTPGTFNLASLIAIYPFSIGGGQGGRGGSTGALISGDALSGVGGGGGAGGGTVFLFARNIIIGPNGRISANGGNGGNGQDAIPMTSGSAHGGGGAGGGGGGFVYVVYENLINAGAIEANGGSGGVGGAPVGTGNQGGTGQDGEDGQVVKINLSIGDFE